jgi:hypothetical protein
MIALARDGMPFARARGLPRALEGGVRLSRELTNSWNLFSQRALIVCNDQFSQL